ncbi:MAG: glycosyltransferase [Phycisphaerales bacterium]|nr:glycosyltransferase [Phycisphaerales bacterium]
MRIALYNDSLRTALGGPTAFVVSLSEMLARAGHEVSVLTADTTDAPAAWNQASNPRLINIGPLRRFGLLTSDGAVRARDALAGVDAAHLSGLWVPSAAQLAAMCRRARVPYVLSLHGTLNDWPMAQSRWHKRLYLATLARPFLRGARFIHCTSLGEQAQATPRLPWGCRTKVIFPPIPLSDASSRMPAAGGRVGPTLLFVGRIHPVKGLEHLIEAMALVRTSGARLTIAGTGDEAYVAQLRALATAKGVADSIQWAGFVEGAAKEALYASAAAFVLPSSQENFGLVLFEALAAGTPVITTRHVDTWRELQSQGNATIVDQDAASIAAGIDQVLAHPSPRQGAMAGRDWARGVLAPENLLPSYLAMYGPDNHRPLSPG